MTLTGKEYRAVVLSGKKKVSVETRKAPPLESGWVRVALAAGGICGSDLHYYRDFANVGYSLKNPVVMGHEASGTIAEVGPEVEDLRPGDKVAVNPVMNCGFCPACQRGEANLCVKKRFFCSAMNYPHVDGFFREYFETQARLCLKVPESTDLYRLAFAEPLACTLHAVLKLGDLAGKKVLVTGSGPIGVLAAAAVRAVGAGFLIVTDVVDEPLAIAKTMGADAVLNTRERKLAESLAEIGPMDAAIEASGAVPALLDCLEALRKGGTMVQLGTTPSDGISVPWIYFQAKEINVLGSSQFNREYAIAVSLIQIGRIDPQPLLSRQFKFEEADQAFAVAGDRHVCMKAQFIP
jgi:L-idonate 5-dehydrogenase